MSSEDIKDILYEAYKNMVISNLKFSLTVVLNTIQESFADFNYIGRNVLKFEIQKETSLKKMILA